jgi:hypothetical protein
LLQEMIVANLNVDLKHTGYHWQYVHKCKHRFIIQKIEGEFPWA